MEGDLKRQSSRGPAETILSAANGHGPVAELLIAPLDRKALGRLRASCRDGRDLVSSQLTQLELVYCNGHKLTARAAGDESGAEHCAESKARAAAAEAAQPSHWPALLAAFPACTDLTIRIGPWVYEHHRAAAVRLARVADLGELLLGPFTAATPSETAARVTRLRLHLRSNTLPPPASLPRLVSCAFPALTHLEVDGYWGDYTVTAATRLRAFYSALAEHLPHLQALEFCPCEGLKDIRLLAASMSELRQLKVGKPIRLFPVSTTAKASAAAAAALGSFQQLRVLLLRGVYARDRDLRDVLRLGLPNTLERFEVSSIRDPYLRLSVAVGAAAAESTSGGGAGGSGGRRRLWDAVLVGSHTDSRAAADAMVAAELSIGRLYIRYADVKMSKSPLLQRCRQVETRRLYLEGDGDARQLGEALQRLGSPELLSVSEVRRRGSLAGLVTFAAAGGLLVARLRRLEFIQCPGLTPAGLIATLTALPLCEEVVVESCPRICIEPQYRSLVQQLLEVAAAHREGEALRGRRGRIRLSGRLPVGANEGAGEEEGKKWWETASTPQPLTAAMVVAHVVRRVVAARITEELNEELARGGLGVRLEVVLVARGAR